ncbi:MAG: tetratricopeptide repeat protein [Actinobacteria bacterium]|nr:tetratricopeptide repeat protein [Actinomycetota bacterium]
MAKSGARKRVVAPSPGAARMSPRTIEPADARMDLWDRIAWAFLHVLVVLVPLAMSNFGPFSPDGVPLTYDQFDIVKVFLQRGILALALAAWAAGLLVRGGRVRFTRGEWVLLAFLAWLLLTTVLSVHPPTAIFGKYRRFEGLLSFITYGVAFFMALQYATTAQRVRSLARSLAVGGFLVAAYGALQVVGTVALGTARVAQPVATLLTVIAPLLFGYMAVARSGDDRELKRAYWTAAVIALIGGAVLSAGLAQNIDIAMSNSTTGEAVRVALDPVRWGRLGFESNRAFSTFGNPDMLGGYLIFPFAVTLGLALSEKHRVWRAIYWNFTLLNVFVGITSYVRGAWIGAVVALGLLIFAYLRARRGTDMRLTQTDVTFIGGAGAVGTAVIAASSLRPDAVRNVLTRVVSIFQFGEGSALTRTQIWHAAADAIAARPVFGWGADTFRLLFPMFKPAEYVEAAGYLSVADNVHNYPLQLASGIGIPGALLFYAAIGSALAIAARTAFARGSAERNLVLAGFWAAVVGYVVHLMFGLSVTGSTVILWLAMGVLLGPVATVHDVAPMAWRMVGLSAVGVALVVVSTLNVRYIAADTHYLRGRVLTIGLERVSEIERAIELNPYNDMYRLELGTAWRDLFRASADEYARKVADGTADSQLKQNTLDYYARASDAYEAMIEYVPQEYDTYVYLANLHNEAATLVDPGYAVLAVDAAERGKAVQRYGPAIRVQLAIGLMLQGRLDEAISELEVACDLDPNYTQAYLVLASADRQAGRYDDARAALGHVLTRFPDDAEALAALQSLEASATTSTGQ